MKKSLVQLLRKWENILKGKQGSLFLKNVAILNQYSLSALETEKHSKTSLNKHHRFDGDAR